MPEDFQKGSKIPHLEYPELLEPLEERVRGPELEGLFAHLNTQVEEIRKELLLGFPQRGERPSEPLPERIVSEILNKVGLYAREFSDHYGGYKVGGVLVGLRKPTPEDLNPWVIYFDANTRPNKQVRKHCAELYLLDRAKNAAVSGELENVVAILVTAEARYIADDPIGLKDDVSGKKQITLTPCALCRMRLTQAAETDPSLISLSDTEIITARSDSENLWIRKFQKLKDLPPFHGEPLPENIQEIDDSNGK